MMTKRERDSLSIHDYERNAMFQAVAECKRFLDRVGEHDCTRSGASHASMIRASMDATRALAKLRRARDEYWQMKQAGG